MSECGRSAKTGGILVWIRSLSSAASSNKNLLRACSDSSAFRIVLDSLWGKLTGSPQSSDICLSYMTRAILLWELTKISLLFVDHGRFSPLNSENLLGARRYLLVCNQKLKFSPEYSDFKNFANACWPFSSVSRSLSPFRHFKTSHSRTSTDRDVHEP